MTFDSKLLSKRLAALTGDEPAARWLLAYSGGIDSTVLLHALSDTRASDPREILAIHVNHGMHPHAPAWEAHCRNFALLLGVRFASRRVAVDGTPGSGPEAAARDARYALLRTFVEPGDCLLSAHHEDDQAETLLLNLLRGSGVAGLAGIGAVQAFGQGRLVRPLLGVSGGDILAYAKRHRLDWIDDPSNAETRFDRNFLRQEIVPRLASRWPAVSARLRQSADLAGEAGMLLDDLAGIDLATAGGSPARLELAALRGMAPPRQRNLLRHAVSLSGLPPPPATRLYQAINELVPAREDAQPLVTWPGAELRRYRDHLYVMPSLGTDPAEPPALLHPGETLDLGPGAGRVALTAGAGDGIRPDLAAGGLKVRFRHGGEEIRPSGRECTHKLKKLLQDRGVVPWMRDRLPLLYSGERLVAVADLWTSADCVNAGGYAVTWREHPSLY